MFLKSSTGGCVEFKQSCPFDLLQTKQYVEMFYNSNTLFPKKKKKKKIEKKRKEKEKEKNKCSKIYIF